MNLEELSRKLAIQNYRMYTGLKYDDSKIEFYNKEIARMSKKNIGKTKDRTKFLWLLENISDSAQSKLFLQQVSQREKISIDGINYSNWRSRVADMSPEKRKKVLDEFFKQAPKINRVIKKRFEAVEKVHKKYNESVLGVYLEEEGFSYKNLIKKLTFLGKQNRKKAYKMWKVLGLEKNYWHEYYCLGSLHYKDIDFKFEPLDHIKLIFRNMNFDFNGVKVDDKDRPKKFGYAYCFWPDAPKDVRVSYKPVGGFRVFESAFHEFGHAAHAISMDESLPYFKKVRVPHGISEIFSMLFESISTSKDYLKYIGAYTPELSERISFSTPKFLTFYAANSITKLMYWKGEISFDEIGTCYSSLLRKFTGLEMPDGYWTYHHIMSEYSIYSPSYMIAHNHLQKLKKRIESRFGKRWWSINESGEFLKEIMRHGSDSTLLFNKSKTF